MARTVLLADDSVTAQNMGRRILMDAGYEVITVNNGSAALKKIHESPPDLIVLDVYMPGYGGLEVCQRLKESGETMRIPVLLTVGKMEPFKSDEAKRVRADGHIVKPFDASELLAALTKLEDRIVPQSESQRGRKGKGERKARFWPTKDSPSEWSDGVAYLAEVKEREAHGGLAEDTPAGKAEDAAANTELPPTTVQSQQPATPASLPSAPEFEVQETVVPSNVAEQQSSPAPHEIPERVPVPPQAAETQETPDTKPLQVPAQDDTSVRAATQETSAESETAAVRQSRWVAENVALTAEEASLELEQEMLKAQAASSEPAPHADEAPELRSETRDEVPVTAQASVPSSSAPVPEQPNQTAENSGSGATFAAVAGASAHAAPVVEPQSSSEAQGEAPLASEARAAWDNWQRIRDSVISAQSSSPVASSVVEALQSIPDAGRETEKSEASSALENAAVASIVETVLAELKPKLMEEIAKKLKK